MPSWRTLLEKDHIGAWDLFDDAGKARTVVGIIEKVEQKKIKSKENPDGKGKPVLTLKGWTKKLICNTTMCQVIQELYGEDFTQWVGQPIAIYPTTCTSFGKPNTPCVRIRNQKPVKRTPDAPSERPVDTEMRAKQNEAADPQGAER